ncbi:PEPxxWA-CTERM sorting domain-containing protein [Novosphingobium sp. G106]|uniref:Npun_F0296 family exosortase-dependent surface protein n=1 Tax=Novosphingobium sp. G106 TaxID=2849500 RepID=UPI001C2D0061|nr:PEPxxWA-CTERM sorting domain-containing protein [Novosphingobium sp. G106]MBV1692514.1 PEPxxWA-CTERM sorting domain-containing protein [Novosphingobium sp. G106]
MKFTVASSAAIALSMMAASGAHAVVVGSLGSSGSPFVTIDSLGTRSGGTIYTSDQPFADIPKGGVYNNQFLAVGQTAGSPSIITFANALNYLSFLWGSPDTYNQLTLTTNLGNTFNFTPQGLNFAVTDGNQSFSQYVQFKTAGGELITSAKFDATPLKDAFEVANFSTGVPEPASWALLILGVGFTGAALRRRRSVSVKYA